MILVDNRQTTDPYINLAIEEYLVRHSDCSAHDYLLLYINDPCVVLGKNQSIYKEVNFEFLRNGRLKLARRVSGGGTVYHDPGNLSFAFISAFAEHKINNYRYFNQLVIDALHSIGVEAVQDSRNNIVCRDKKISGNAQFTNRKNIISHGTLLYDADLSILRSCLKENDFKIETKAVGSQRSSVMNIKEECKGISDIKHLRAFLQESLGAKEVYCFHDNKWNQILQMASTQFNSFSWIYGRSPQTIVNKEGIQITVEDGKIKAMQSDHKELLSLVGLNYEFTELRSALKGHTGQEELLRLIF